MKFDKIAAVVLLSLGMATSGAYAADAQGSGTVTFTGNIIDAPCSINPSSSKQTVELGSIASAALAKEGKSNSREFTIELENCSLADDSEPDGVRAANAKSVTVTFGGQTATGTNLLGITGTAAGAGVGIVDASGKQVVIGQASAAQTLLENDNTMVFSAYLQGLKSATIEPGDFTSIANFTLDYQ